MMDVDISRLVPQFLLTDHNGYALSKAIELGLQIFCQVIHDGTEVVLNVDTMPEWRLDEMAWEMNCLYDFDAGVQEKRGWIRNAVRNFAQFGTVASIESYLSSYFGYTTVEENWEYGGQPFHFRVSVNDNLTEKQREWAANAVSSVKNVRSVLDDILLHISATIEIETETENFLFPYVFPGDDVFSGQIPNSVI